MVGPESQVRTFAIPAQSSALADIRREVAAVAESMPFTKTQVEDIKLAVGEALANAVRHGSPGGAACRVVVLCHKLEDGLLVEISDEGCGFDPGARGCALPDTLVEGGRGLFFMQTLMDEVEFSFDRVATVRMVKKCRPNSTRQDTANHRR